MTGNTDLEVKFAPKQREMLQKFRVSLKISWEPGSLGPGEYPTLGCWLLSVTGHFPLRNKNQAGAELRQARSSLGKLELSLIRHRL